jgi:hypothetical protein
MLWRASLGWILLAVAMVACSAAPAGKGPTGAGPSGSTGSTSSGGTGGVASTGTGGSGAGGTSFVGSGGNLGAGGGPPTCTPSSTTLAGTCAAMGIQIAPAFAADYTCIDLGTVPSVPSPWGGFAMKANDPSTLLVTGNARTPQGRLYAVPIGRDKDCHVTGFTGTSSDVAEAPYNEAGVAYGPGGVLFLAQAVINKLGELKPGSTVTDKVVDLGALGQAPTACGVGFVPTGFPGQGRLKLVNWPSPGHWYDAPYAMDATGTYDVTLLTPVAALGNGAAGFVFIAAGNVDFPNDSVLISEYDVGTVAAYTLTGNSDPDPMTRQVFISGLTGAQGGVLDPVSGDFLFSTYSTARIIAVRGFKPPPPPPK